MNRVLTYDGMGVTEDVADVVAGPLTDGVRFQYGSTVLCRIWLFADTDLSIPLTYLHATFCRAVAAGHYTAVAVGFVEGDFITGPIYDSVGGGCFG